MWNIKQWNARILIFQTLFKTFKDGIFIFPQIKSYLSQIMTFYLFLFPTTTNYKSNIYKVVCII